MIKKTSRTATVLADKRNAILHAWTDAQPKDPRSQGDGSTREQFRRKFEGFLDALIAATAAGNLQNIEAPEYAGVRKLLTDIALRQERSGSTAFETAAAVISLKDHWVPHLQSEYAGSPELLNDEIVAVSRLVDTLALTTLEAMIKRREEIIAQQSREILELSTPVVQVWDGVVVAPLIGALDSQRTQQFMERLLERIVQTNSPVALVDITGVSTIDTQTAQHLIDTVSAVRLLGAQIVLTGVRPSTAQTLVHLGINLSGITTRSSLAAGLRVALEILNLKVVPGDQRS